MTFAPAKRRCIYKKVHYLTFDLDLVVKVTRNVAQYPLYHVTYSATMFEVAMSNGLGGDTFTRNITDGRRTVFGTKLIYPFSLKKIVGITISPFSSSLPVSTSRKFVFDV